MKTYLALIEDKPENKGFIYSTLIRLYVREGLNINVAKRVSKNWQIELKTTLDETMVKSKIMSVKGVNLIRIVEKENCPTENLNAEISYRVRKVESKDVVFDSYVFEEAEAAKDEANESECNADYGGDWDAFQNDNCSGFILEKSLVIDEDGEVLEWDPIA